MSDTTKSFGIHLRGLAGAVRPRAKALQKAIDLDRGKLDFRTPERWQSGRMRRFAKPLYWLIPVPRVRIPPSPPAFIFCYLDRFSHPGLHCRLRDSASPLYADRVFVPLPIPYQLLEKRQPTLNSVQCGFFVAFVFFRYSTEIG